MGGGAGVCGFWDDCACADLGGLDDCGVERVVDERAFAGKLTASSMSMSSVEWLAACAGAPRVMSPDRLKYCLDDASLGRVRRGIKRERKKECCQSVMLSLSVKKRLKERKTDVFPPAYDASRRRAMMIFGV